MHQDVCHLSLLHEASLLISFLLFPPILILLFLSLHFDCFALACEIKLQIFSHNSHHESRDYYDGHSHNDHAKWVSQIIADFCLSIIAFSFDLMMPWNACLWLPHSNREHLFLLPKLFWRHAAYSRWVLKRSSYWTAWSGCWVDTRRRDWRVRLVESKRTEGDCQVTQGQTSEAPGTHLRVHHDRETSLPDAASHAESIRRQSTTSLQSPELGADVSTASRADWTAYRVS